MRSGWCRAVAVAALLAVTTAMAHGERPGGGQGFSGDTAGGRSYASDADDSGESDGGDGAALLLLFELLRLGFSLTFRYPAVMWPFWGLAGLSFVLWARSLPTRTADVDPNWTWESFRQESMAATTIRPASQARTNLESLRELDPGFSLILFEDFVQALFARVHDTRGRQRLEDMTSYLSVDARQALARMGPQLSAVEGIVIGAIRYVRVRGLHADSLPDSPIVVELEIEANYTEVPETTVEAPSAFWVTEGWTLRRARSARSRPPSRVRSFGCPGCGAPLRGRDAGVCLHCGIPIDPSEFDWIVERVRVIERRRTPPALAGSVAETGTTLETIVDPAAAERLRLLEARDAGFTWPAFEARVQHIFAELQPAWTDQDLRRARPYLSDQLAATWTYWFDAYRRAGLRNVTEAARVTALQLARVTSDRHYDAITVRVHATGLDYTIDQAGHVRSGSRETPRQYSEYWTLIRGHSAVGPPCTTATCPRCGAPLAVNMAGHCEQCQAHVSAGEFDWVLSRVEQDESYRG